MAIHRKCYSIIWYHPLFYIFFAMHHQLNPLCLLKCPSGSLTISSPSGTLKIFSSKNRNLYVLSQLKFTWASGYYFRIYCPSVWSLSSCYLMICISRASCLSFLFSEVLHVLMIFGTPSFNLYVTLMVLFPCNIMQSSS